MREKKRNREKERKRGFGWEEKEENLGAQGTDSPSVSSYDLSGKGAKLDYLALVYDYVYVLLIICVVSIVIGFRLNLVKRLEIDVFTDESRNKFRSLVE